ncbi:MAG: hexokinase [Treponema sp.]|nr:hexokinase [Treponema sp.]
MEKVNYFMSKHNFTMHSDVLTLAKAIQADMQKGLRKEGADQDMIRTFCNPGNEPLAGKSVIVIDAGGTNFRSCLVTFNQDGKPEISDMEKTKMPGVDKELTKEQFFNQFADNIEHLKNKADRIGFCFSYPMEILENGDGKLIGFTKEVKAPEVVGCEIGKCLVEELNRRGWNPIKRITLCNDTVAALLAGVATAPKGTDYSSYVGFILGTGMNAAYIQPDCDVFNIKKQIIVCESGRFKGVLQSDFDKEYDAGSANPGTALLEKTCSGGYLGPVAQIVLQTAAKEKLFSSKTNEALLKISNLQLIQFNEFLDQPYNEENVLGKIAVEGTDEDAQMIYELLDALVERSARHAAAILTACALQCGEGKLAVKPINFFCDGSTFFKTTMLKERVHGYLDEVLTRNLGIYWKISTCDNDITLGAAISGLID